MEGAGTDLDPATKDTTIREKEESILNRLTDGYYGSGEILDGNWNGSGMRSHYYEAYRQIDRAITLDLGQLSHIESLSFHMQEGLGWGISAPSMVTYFLSEDGVTFHRVGRVSRFDAVKDEDPDHYYSVVENGKEDKKPAAVPDGIEYVMPQEIEKRSFSIIEEELQLRGITLPVEEAMVTKRVIHTSADFSYAQTMTYSTGAVETAKWLITEGADIVTDTNMALSGINKRVLARYGGSVHCFMADEDVAREAKERGVTRATVSMERAAKIEKPVIFAIGNAPTALIQLYGMIEEGYRPAFIIGVPVGFVNVEAAKELILQTKIPHIVNRGRKGGSNVAAAICNAILYELGR